MLFKIACDIGLLEIDIDYDKKILLLKCDGLHDGDDSWVDYSQMYPFGKITLVLWIDILEEL